jgi:predicted amidohydrolase YtcJ
MPETRSTPVLAIVNARVWTNDPRRPWADALLVRGEHLLAVGSSAELRKRAGGGATVIDASGRLVVPGEAGGRLVAGAAASLAIIERPLAAGATGTPLEREVVLSLVDGRVVVDRRGESR